MTIYSKAPLRLGLAGGGSDVSPYSDIYGGNILNATINLGAYCAITPHTLPVIRIQADDAGVRTEIPFGTGPVNTGAILIDGVANRVARDFGPLPCGFDIRTWNDAAAGSGLGTSSTMVVAILKCFSRWMGFRLTKHRLARLAYEIEREDLMLAGGKQDQYAAAFGGFNFMGFNTDGSVSVEPLQPAARTVRDLEASMLLYFTGKSRESAAIIKQQQSATRAGKTSAVEAMHRIRQSALDMREVLMDGDLTAFAEILGRAWEDKKKMADAITNPMIQTAFDTALAAGALSGKVSGAGGGGFMMLMVPPSRKASVAEALQALGGEVVPFRFTKTGAKAWKR